MVFVLQGVSVAGNTQENALFLVSQPHFFDVQAALVPVTCVVVGFGRTQATVETVECTAGGTKTVHRGHWRALDLSEEHLNREQFRDAWACFSDPGVKSGWAAQASNDVKRLLDKHSTRFDEITVLVPTPTGATAGTSYPLTVTAQLSDGSLITAAGTPVAQTITVPSGWIRGDTHIHSDVGDHSSLSLVDIKSLAMGKGHEFTYVTDHIDLIRSETAYGSANRSCGGGANPGPRHRGGRSTGHLGGLAQADRYPGPAGGADVHPGAVHPRHRTRPPRGHRG